MPEIKDKDKVKVPVIDIKDESEIYALGSRLYKKFSSWKDKKRKIEEQWLKNLRAYNSIYDASVRAGFDVNGSDQYIGITRMKTTAAYSRLVDVYFPASGHKFWGITPTPYPTLSNDLFDEEDFTDPRTGEQFTNEELLTETTNRMSARIDDQLVEADADALIRSAIKDACIYGSGVIKAGMVKVERKRNWAQGVEGWDLVQEDHIVPGIGQPSPFDVYFDINAKNAESSIGVFERHVLNKEEVRDLKGLTGFREGVIEELIEDYPEGNHNREHHETERQTIGNIEHFETSGYYEVLEYWGYLDGEDLRDAGMDVAEEDLKTGYSANVWFSGHKVIKILIDESINKGRKYFVFPYEQISNQLWGVGVPEIMMDSQDVLNSAFRRLLDDIAMTGNQLEINVDLLDDRSVNNAYKIKPWKIWYRSGGDGTTPAITVHKVPSIGTELISIITMVRNFIDDETNLPSLISGQPLEGDTPGANTVGGMSMLMGAAQIVIKSVVKNIDDFLIKPLIKSYYNFNMEWSMDENIKGDMKVEALGSSVLVAKEIQSKTMSEFLTITANEFDLPLVRRPRILRKIARNMGLDEEDIKTDKEIKKEMNTPDPMEEKIKELAIEKAELENSLIRAEIDVANSEADKNLSKIEYDKEFLRQRRIKLAEEIKEARKLNAGKINKDDAKPKKTVNKSKVSATPVKILNQ